MDDVGATTRGMERLGFRKPDELTHSSLELYMQLKCNSVSGSGDCVASLYM